MKLHNHRNNWFLLIIELCALIRIFDVFLIEQSWNQLICFVKTVLNSHWRHRFDRKSVFPPHPIPQIILFCRCFAYEIILNFHQQFIDNISNEFYIVSNHIRVFNKFESKINLLGLKENVKEKYLKEYQKNNVRSL